MAFRKNSAVAIAALLACSAAAALVHADDGELFPNVKAYDQEVPSPVSKPEKALDHAFEKAIHPPPLTLPQTPKNRPPDETKTAEPPTAKTPAAPVIPPVRFGAYRDALFGALMSAESETRFEKEFAPRLKEGLKKISSDKGQTAETVWKEADAAGVPGDLKRVLWLHALGLCIKGDSKLETRGEKAKAVLPLLTDETLPIAQARADAVTELAFGALTNASDALLAIVLESQCKLARMQVQGGFPDEAAASLKVARDAFRYLKEKTDSQKDAVAEAGVWVDRATAARISAAKWQETLTAKPADGFVNTQMATLNLSLYGDVEKAARFAAKSDRKEFQAFAVAVGHVNGSLSGGLSASDGLVVTGALLDLAETAMPLPFDRYSVGSLVETKLREVAAAGTLDSPQTQRAGTLKSRAEALITKSGIHTPQYPALASLLETPAAGNGSATGAATAPAKVALFVKDNGTLVRYVKPTPKENIEALVSVRNEAKNMAEKTKVKFTEVETEHCLIFTDWEASEYGFLKKNVEAAYVAVARQYDFPMNENIFPGKLPVFMFATKDGFTASFGKTSSETTIFGYFGLTDEGVGVILMYKPVKDRFTKDPLSEWGRRLTWMMGNAFERRYRTNKELPDWLAQGFSAHIARTAFPEDLAIRTIRRWAQDGKGIENLFPKADGDYNTQAVSGSMVAMLIARDKKAFIAFLNKLKDGDDQAAALMETYKWTYADADKAWRTWVTHP